MDHRKVSVSKFLSLVLRHKPEKVGISLDRGGWVPIDSLLTGCKENGLDLSRDTLLEIVDQDTKSRFTIRDGLIRANQGHSIEIDLGLRPQDPPSRLFHGTATRFLDSIRSEGLRRKGRQFVHLSPDVATAISVGKRHGKPVVLTIDALSMKQAGIVFFLSENGVWLTQDVPIKFIEIPNFS